ncbi:hypothetical protein FACS189426_01150 [Bacteroidia bacterium]|nr:hypothetical protein FACS189426_01150 [Bacteroidia bacterium]
MDYEHKIEFYKNRNLGERFSAAIDFLKQNWKVLYKNVFIIAIPLSLISGYSMQYYTSFSGSIDAFDFSKVAVNIITSFIYGIFLCATTGTVLLKYEEGTLTKKSGWNDLKATLIPLSGKACLINLVVGGIFIAITVLYGWLAFALASDDFPLMALALFIYIAVVVALLPSFSLVYFPAFFTGKSAFESIKIATNLGFKNWGTTFVVILLVSVFIFGVSLIFSIPNTILTFAFAGEHNFLTFISASVASFSTAIITPFVIVLFAFQYFAITEKEEGISLQTQVDDFENL